MGMTGTQNTILLVDDDKGDRLFARQALDGEDYQILEAMNGQRLAELLAQYKIDLILLDLKLPGEDGLALIETIRHNTLAPIIIISGMRDIANKRTGFDSGADDYITKPFQPEELCARIKASLRRYKEFLPQRASTQINIGSWILNRENFTVRNNRGEDCGLTIHEYRLLEKLALSSHRILTRNDINPHSSGRSIDVQITRLRKKIGDRKGSFIKTVRGIGYRLDCPVDFIN